jgi:hypothetical protein
MWPLQKALLLQVCTKKLAHRGIKSRTCAVSSLLCLINSQSKIQLIAKPTIETELKVFFAEVKVLD